MTGRRSVKSTERGILLYFTLRLRVEAAIRSLQRQGRLGEPFGGAFQPVVLRGDESLPALWISALMPLLAFAAAWFLPAPRAHE